MSFDKNDMKRNELVCIFLRLLEYYEGILFLPISGTEQIDSELEARAQIPIRYSALSDVPRRRIWNQVLDRPNTG
ncbi:hypothetical protein BDW68DRAFT_172613 [Aspergillus falconensis]